jgi:hypothetical protein
MNSLRLSLILALGAQALCALPVLPDFTQPLERIPLRFSDMFPSVTLEEPPPYLGIDLELIDFRKSDQRERGTIILAKMPVLAPAAGIDYKGLLVKPNPRYSYK